MFNTIREKINRDKTQRILYFAGIPLWTILWYLDDLDQYPNKTLDLVWAVPALLLLFQVVFNNKLMWAIQFSFFCLYGGAIFLGTTYSMIRHGYFISVYTGYYIINVLLLTAFIWTFYQMQPARQKTIKPVV